VPSCSDKNPKSTKPWDDYGNNGDARNLDKLPLMVAKRFFDYGTGDKDEAAEIVSTISFTPTAKVSRNGVDRGKLLVASMPCACLSCRKKMMAVPCLFNHISQQRELWVSAAREQNERTPRSTGHDEIHEQRKQILEIVKLTKAVLTE
jgi:hypothetical protein